MENAPRARFKFPPPAFFADPPIGLWLIFTVFYIAVVALVGGATRLTDSGLSITEWKPLLGVIPPLSDADWQTAFMKYQLIPQASQVNADMDLAGFKTIYWWEWGHRLLARFIGVVFLVPFLYFLARGRLTHGRLPKMLGLLALGGLQGFIGWWMVESGLVDRIDVSQYRLMVHLGLATLLMVLMLVLASREFRLPPYLHAPRIPRLKIQAWAIVVLTFVQILLGALVAGLDAGLIFNTWPDMNGTFLPTGTYGEGWISAFEGHSAVQFNHRIGAYLLFVLAIYHAVACKRAQDPDRAFAFVVFTLVGVQAVLGITTLLAMAPFGLSLMHQATAFLTIGFATWHACRFHGGTAGTD